MSTTSWAAIVASVAGVNGLLSTATAAAIFAENQFTILTKMLLGAALVAFFMAAVFGAALTAWIAHSAGTNIEKRRMCCVLPYTCCGDKIADRDNKAHECCKPHMRCVLLTYVSICTLSGLVLAGAAIMTHIFNHDVPGGKPNYEAYLITLLLMPLLGFILLAFAACNMWDKVDPAKMDDALTVRLIGAHGAGA